MSFAKSSAFDRVVVDHHVVPAESVVMRFIFFIFKVATRMIYHPLKFLTTVLCCFLSYGSSVFWKPI
jgi:hypothetical protein